MYFSDSYVHDRLSSIGVLLVNLGTPAAPTPKALRDYLGEFLADPRLTELPRWLWWPLLHGIILRVRPRRVAHKYQKIWTPEGSPLLTISQTQVRALQQVLDIHFPDTMKVTLGMRYGHPSIATGLSQLCHAQKILILPLYPQYSSPTSGSTFDAVGAVFKHWRWLPDIRFVSHYHDHTDYIHALTTQIKNYWALHGHPDQLLFSFHGIPQRFFQSGDPYFCECHKTARLVAEQLGLLEQQWQVVFQSRFGKEKWLTPYTDHTLKHLGQTGVPRVDVICPGFAADCLETLEEINQENRRIFLSAGGQTFHYIPALNAIPEHIQALLSLVIQHTQGWVDPAQTLQDRHQEARLRQQRAIQLGASS